MAVPILDIVRASLQDLWKLDKAKCNQMLQSYNGTAASAEPMTVRTLSLTVVLMMMLSFTIFWSGCVRMIVGPQQALKRLEPAVHFLLRGTLVLSLPALTSVFSLRKAEGGTGFLLTLLWLLLVELIRMKVEGTGQRAGGSSFSRSAGRFTLMDSAEEVARTVWTGYLIFFNMEGQTHGDKREKKWAAAMLAMFAFLWSLSVLKLVQIIIDRCTEGLSWHTGRNPLLIAAYMQHVATKQEEEEPPAPASPPDDDDAMESCRFVVEGEHHLVLEKKKARSSEGGAEAPAPCDVVVTTVGYGYGVGGSQHDQSDLKHVSLHLDANSTSKLVTVGKVWGWGKQSGDGGEDDIRHIFSGPRGSYLQDLCFSLSLFKLLRRRFEQYPMVEVGSDMVRRVMLKGLLNLNFDAGGGPYRRSMPSDRAFRVLLLELDFLQHYYQTADRAVMSRRSVFFTKAAFTLFLLGIYLMAILAILVTTKDAVYFYCMAMVSSSRHENFPYLAFFITWALLVTFMCVETYDMFTSYLNFNWNLVRLLCYFGNLPAANRKRIGQRLLPVMIKFRYWIYSMTSHLFRRHAYIDVRMNQESILDACGAVHKWVYECTKGPAVYLSAKAKGDIIQAMKLINEETLTVSLPQLVGLGNGHDESTGRWTVTTTATEVILASHLATELFVIRHPLESETTENNSRHLGSAREVATTLSRYCMYLVANTPELLPDDEVWVSRRFKDMRACLDNLVMQCMPGRCCNCKKKSTLLDSLKAERHRLDDTTTRRAVELFEEMEKVDKMEGWNHLACFWVRLIIYLAPSNDVQGHAKALDSSGADLISCLWAFCTHTGITREQLQGRHAVVEV